MHHLSIDLETYSSVSIRDAGAQRYIASDDFEILLFAYSVDGLPVQIIDLAQGEVVPEWIVQSLKDPNIIKHAYNAPFEFGCLSKYYGPMIPAQWRCTMFHGLYCGYTAGLEATGKALGLPEDKQKLNTGKALIRYFCVPCRPTKVNGGRTRNYPHHDPEKWALFKEYCCQDVVTEMEIERRLSSFPVPDFVQNQWETDLTINMRGVAVDIPFVDGALYIGEQSKAEMMERAVALSGLNNPNSVSQLSKWVDEHTGPDVEITDMRKDTVIKLLKRDDLDHDTREMLQIRQELGKTSTKKYDAIKTCVCPDNRVRGLLQFYGANRTGRWAGRLVQVQNLPRTYTDPIELARELVAGRKRDALKCCYGSINDTLSQLIRTAFVASPGNVLVDADFSAIEARVISWLAGERWRLDVFRTHGKIYEASASQMFGVPIELIKKGNPEYALRAKGKVAELALGYQGGPGALIAMGALDMGLHEEELPDIVSRWRNANSHIQSLWWEMNEAAIKVIEYGGSANVHGLWLSREYDYNQGHYCFTILLPSGRKLYYVRPKIGTNRFGGKSITYMGIDQTTKKWKENETYGGKLTENVVQAIARDCLAEAIERLEAAGFPIVFHVHDEVVIDIKPYADNDTMLNQVCDIMRQPPAWAKDMPLNAAGWVGDFFTKD
ncbi:MAG: DNA polymerase [Eubacterium sp.]|nr:DNA polymerase [Eubacterium sp.]